MRLFGALYDRVLKWSAHPKARWYLGALSFAESSFFPIPPDVMLAPMTLARPAEGWRLATLTTMCSVVGGAVGYLLGLLMFDMLTPVLERAGYWDAYLLARDWFEQWGFWAILAAGFSPIPYKVFTIAAGALAMNAPLFLIASIIGRGARFFLVAGLIVWGGEGMERWLRRNVDWAGWAVVVLLVIAYLLLRG